MSLPAMASAGKISLCMMTKDEEAFLPACLKSVEGLWDEVVIVDTGSTDRTISIAESFGARVYRHPWQNDYSLHRNQSISYATGEWILILDADEVIAGRDLDLIRKLLISVPADGFSFTLRNYESTIDLANLVLNPNDYEEGRGYPGFIGCDLIRLFRNDPLIRFTGQVHETVSPSFRQAKKREYITGIPIHHYGKVRQDRIRQKQALYLSLGIERLQQNPNDPVAYKGLTDQYLDSGEPAKALEVANRGLALFPELIELHFNRGLALDRMDRAEEAEREYLWILEKKPDHLGACHNLGQIYLQSDRLEEAHRWLKTGIEKGLCHPSIFMLLGRIFSKAGQWEPALSCFDAVQQIQTDYLHIDLFKAIPLLNMGRMEEGVDSLGREISKGGDRIAAYHLLGQVSLNLSDFAGALFFFKKILELDPQNEAALGSLNRIPASFSNS